MIFSHTTTTFAIFHKSRSIPLPLYQFTFFSTRLIHHRFWFVGRLEPFVMRFCFSKNRCFAAQIIMQQHSFANNRAFEKQTLVISWWSMGCQVGLLSNHWTFTRKKQCVFWNFEGIKIFQWKHFNRCYFYSKKLAQITQSNESWNDWCEKHRFEEWIVIKGF